MELDYSLFEESDRTLLTVSGGIDSMVMFELFFRNRAIESFAVAHCNFSLRGEESDADTELVERVCQQRGVTLHTIRFDTLDEMSIRGLSMQQCARELRYEWFERLCREFGYTKIATAHNLDDSVETFFVNSTRGCGVRGLMGIPRTNNTIIRPILNSSRKDIEEFAKMHNVAYRQDNSNLSNKYLRNEIRLDIIPKLKNRNRNYLGTMQSNMQHISAAVEFIDYTINNLSKEYISTDGQTTTILYTELLKHPLIDFVWYEIMSRWGFGHDISHSMLESAKKRSIGRVFVGTTHTSILNRESIEIYQPEHYESKQLNKLDSVAEFGHTRIELSHCQLTPDIELKRGKDCAIFDFDKVSDRLVLRSWQQGDSIRPFGMRGRKLVSDIFIDNKLSGREKYSTPILTQPSGEILWVVGLRTDDRFRVSESTTRVLICRIEQN